MKWLILALLISCVVVVDWECVRQCEDKGMTYGYCKSVGSYCPGEPIK